MSGRRPNTNATYDTVYVRITLSLVYNDGVPNDWFWSVTPDKVPLTMTPTPDKPDRVVFTVETPFNAQDGQPGIPPQFGWDDDGQPGATGGIVMDPGWDPSWGVPARGTGEDQHHYVLDITQSGPAPNHPYSYTVNLKTRSTKIRFDPEIELGSA